MLRISSIAFAVVLLTADIPGTVHLRPASKEHLEFPSSDNLPVLPDMSPAGAQDGAPQAAAVPEHKPVKLGNTPLQPESRLSLVRFVDGEFARVVVPIPAGKNGFHLKAGAPIDETQLRMALGSAGSAANPGDHAQITGLEFKDRQIGVEINGGGRGKKRLRDKIHLEISGLPTAQAAPPGVTEAPKTGATVWLDFDRPLPDMTPEDLKEMLSGMLDFSKQHSAAVQWIDTLPPEMQNAIKDKHPAVGMDREMVLAAIGHPDRKVRERTPAGSETEDWIYGMPPAKTVFVKFEGERVIQVQEFPR